MELVDIAESRRSDAEQLLESVAGSRLGAKRLAAAGRVRALEGGEELAACVVTSDRDDGALVIEAIAVAPDRRGSGVGRAIVETLHGGSRRLVAEASEDAVGFFRRCGFAIASAGGTPYRRRYVCTLG